MAKNIFFAIATLVSLSSFAAGPVTLICKGSNPNYRAATVSYQKLTVTTPTGPKEIYAPTDVFYMRAFAPAKIAAGDKGQNLATGECGLANSTLVGVSTDPSNQPTLKMRSFNMYYASLYTFSAPGSGGVTTALNGQAILPTCTTNVFQFNATQMPNANMFETVGDASVTCLK